MKKLSTALLVLALSAVLLTGCGCSNSSPATQPTMMPTILPTAEDSRPMTTTEPSHATQNTSLPTSAATSGTDATGMTEPGSMTETTEPMTKESGRVRSHVNGNF